MKRKMPFIAALSILCWGCSSYDYSGDDIVGVKAAISGTITEVVEKSRTVGTTWTDGDRIGVTCEDDVNISYKVTTKKRNAERYSDRIELQGFQSCFRLFVKPSQSPLKPNQDAATLLVRNHARNGDKRTRITKQGVKD